MPMYAQNGKTKTMLGQGYKLVNCARARGYGCSQSGMKATGYILPNRWMVSSTKASCGRKHRDAANSRLVFTWLQHKLSGSLYYYAGYLKSLSFNAVKNLIQYARWESQLYRLLHHLASSYCLLSGSQLLILIHSHTS